ncbi:M3 family metallopeptidase [uncultured Imperialibacter sp.]|uniref:M3 family metallopeptidase n=1 Tax=uncultured Imperialibacter sp. TaxID=1672639 RepID=UPI0030DC93FD|tara:strand:+ start:1052 stop:3091 length:2040 start_codon:yes stop_codon:yes gene_type:complete
MSNPLLENFNTPFDTIPFSKIKNEHFLPAFIEGIRLAKEEIALLTESTEPATFENTVVALEASGNKVDLISNIFFNLNSAETSDEMQALAKDISPLLSEFSNDVMLNEELFRKVKLVYESVDKTKLDEESLTLLEKTYKGFVRNGANLPADKKEKLRAIDKEISVLGQQYGENVLKETNAFSMDVTDEKELEGLPDFVKEAAAETAREKGKEGTWTFTLQYPSYIPFMTYSANRELRKKMFMAYGSRSFKGNEFDNQEVVKKLVQLRFERAHLLGYPTHAHFVLEERMAETPDKVNEFLTDILAISQPATLKDVEELTAYAKKLDGLGKIERWDFAYYSEKLKKEKYEVDDELLKPYFQLEKVIDGVFKVAEKLFGIHFVENKEIDRYHPEVLVYEVRNDKKELVAIFYADFFPREGKRGGAWMTVFRQQKKVNGEDKRPHISIVCSFTKPTKSTPSLLTFNEVQTLFHEFGHALHGMLAKGNYGSLSGTNVYWDFVELPSQILENWTLEKDCLDLFARHYKTGEAIHADLVQRLKESANFQAGYATTRQVAFGMLDMAYHGVDPSGIKNIGEFEKALFEKMEVLPQVKETNMSCQFSHIFNGGYSSGYYSYKWAEVLDADAFEFFKEKGIFNSEVAGKFKDNILSKGGSEHPMILYKKFRGREPDPKALLRRAGLLKK